MDATVRRRRLPDLDSLVHFAAEEAREAERIDKAPATLRAGILAALENEQLALYWVLADEGTSRWASSRPSGSGATGTPVTTGGSRAST